MSSGLSLPLRARCARSLMARASWGSDLPSRILHHRHHQPFEVEIHGNAEIDALVQGEVIAAEARIEAREFRERCHGRVRDERQVGKRIAFAALPLCAGGAARLVHPRKIRLHHLQHVRDRCPRLRHVLGGALANDVERYGLGTSAAYRVRRTLFRPGDRGGAALLDMSQHILASNATVPTAAGDLRGIQRVFCEELPHDRRQALLGACSRRASGGWG